MDFLQPCPGMTSLHKPAIYLDFYFLFFFRATFSNFLSVWLSRMCPWKEKPTTDAAEILPVKVFLIINGGPPYWQNSRLPVDGHHTSLTHCHELFLQNMLTLAYTQIHACTQAHTWRKHETHNGHMEASGPTWWNVKHTHTHTHTQMMQCMQ